MSWQVFSTGASKGMNALAHAQAEAVTQHPPRGVWRQGTLHCTVTQQLPATHPAELQHAGELEVVNLQGGERQTRQ